MINPFKMGGAMKKMWDIQNALKKIEVDVEKNGVRVVMTGTQQVKEIESKGRSDNDIKEAVNEAISQSQKAAAKTMQEMGGGLEGLLGGA